MFTDEQRRIVWERIRQCDLKVFASVLSPQLLSQAATQAGLSVGRGSLNLATLAWLSLAAALRPGVNFCLILTDTFRLLSEMDRLPQSPCPRRPRNRCAGRRCKHDPRSDQPVPSEEAFVQARARMPQGYWMALILLLGQIFESRHGSRLQWKGFRLLALDGTCISLPRYHSLGEHFGHARNKSGTPRPQARMVMLLLASVRMPWRYELTPRDQGESTVASRLLQHARPNDLVLMDRGFFRFGLFTQIQERAAFFAIRRIKRLHVRTLRKLGKHERIVRWTPAAHRWKGASMQLRVIDYQVRGFRRSAIVTNLLDPRQASRRDFIGLSGSQAWATQRDAGLYHQRWQIETAFREIKRVQRMQDGLRGRTRAAIEYEVAGHVLLYLLVRWLMVEAAQAQDQNPLRLSFTAALHEVHHFSTILPLCTPARQRRMIVLMLDRIAQHTIAFRPGRHYPRPNDGKVRFTGKGYRILTAHLTRCET